MKNELTNEIREIFAKQKDRYLAHKMCKPILEKMANSIDVLQDIIKENLSSPDFLLKRRHYSTLSMNIFESPEFSFVMNIFPPLPDRNTEVSFQSIHHHGSLLLSTVSAFGPGYESIVFKQNFEIDFKTGITNMEVEKVYQNEFGKVEFIDSNQPHVVFYPKDFSATYALWCDNKSSKKEALKKLDVFKSIKKPLSKLINKTGLGKFLGLNDVQYFDFYVEEEKIMALKNRVTYNDVADNDNFLQNIFCFIQKTKFSDVPFLTQLMNNKKTPENSLKFIKMLLNDEPISDNFYNGHLNIKYVNLNKNEIEKSSKTL